MLTHTCSRIADHTHIFPPVFFLSHTRTCTRADAHLHTHACAHLDTHLLHPISNILHPALDTLHQTELRSADIVTPEMSNLDPAKLVFLYPAISMM